MEWIDDLQEKTVGLDTAPLIYFIEENPAYIETVRFFFDYLCTLLQTGAIGYPILSIRRM